MDENEDISEYIVYCNTDLPQEARRITGKNLSSHLKELERKNKTGVRACTQNPQQNFGKLNPVIH